MKKHCPPPRAPLTLDELRRLRAAVRTPLERAVLLTLLDTGVRRSELLGVRERDVDENGHTLLIHGKGDRSRLVAVGVAAGAAIAKLRNGAGPGGPNARLWPFGKTTLKRLLDDLGERAEPPVPGCYPHRLRVTMVCHLITRGVDAISVGVVAGHSLEMVRYYGRAVEQRRALELQRRLALSDAL